MKKVLFSDTVGKIGIKPFIIAVLVVLFLIPLSMITSLVHDREFYRDSAIQSVLQPKGGEPVLEGLVLALPYEVTLEGRNADGSVYQRKETRYILSVPQNWNFTAEVQPEYLVRGIFDVPVFSCDTLSSGNFQPVPYETFKVDENRILWDEAMLLVGISNKKNFTALPVITVNGTPLEQSVTELQVSPFSHTVFFKMPADSVKQGFDYTMKASLQGGNSLSLTPLAENNTFEITSDWPNPGFSGGWLSVERTVTDNGFEARWDIAGLSTIYPKSWIATGGEEFGDMYGESITAEFITPVDNYQKTMRSVKYAVLFLIIPFLTIFIFEIFTRVRIHPVQYCLIGFADVLFYLLLLAISEHLTFGATYFISALAVCLTTLGYGAAIFRKLKWGVLFALVQGITYVFLFGTLQAEDYALLIGTLGLFCVVVALMVLTRKVDWYGTGVISEEKQE